METLGSADPGTNGTATLCSNGAAVQLIDSLNGTPDAGGTWSGPAAHPGTFDPATDAPGAFTYTVGLSSATVTVTVHGLPSAGTAGTLISCINGPAVDLFTRLGDSPDVGGAWTLAGNPVSNMFTPGTSAAGTYTYTVTGTPPCPNASANVVVTVIPLANAGTPGSLNTCSNGPVVDLITRLGGSPDAGGACTLSGNPVSNMFTPGTSVPGTYVYTVNGTPPCPNASANVVVTVVTAPNAGTSRSITVCSDDIPFSMRFQLGGTPDAGGTWSPGGSDTFTPGTSAPGPYVYTVTGTAPCSDASATLTITVRTAPNAGSNRMVTVCSDGAVFNLVDSLGGSPDVGGTWTGPGGAHSGQFQPSTDLGGAYAYHVAGQAPCDPAIATVNVTVRTAPNAGTSVSVVKCSNDASFLLRTQLGGTPATTGTWKGPDNLPFPSGTFIPGTTPPGTYTYTVTGLSPCLPATSTVNLSVIQAPNAGLDSTFSVCSTEGTFALFPRLKGNPDVGGTWTGPGGSPVPSGTFNPATSLSGDYTYRVTGTSPCVDATAKVTVTVVPAANAGSNGSVTLCSTSPNEDLFTHLGGTPNTGGSWTKPTPPGGLLAGGIYQPSNAAHPAGTYTYTVSGTTPCPNVSATVQVVENQAPNAGVDATTPQCSTNPPFNMATILGGPPDPGGTWRNAANATVPATFTPGVTPSGVYRYVVTGLAPCPNDTSKVTVNVATAPKAGTNGATVVCSDDDPVDLFALLGGSPDAGGTWKDPNNQNNNGSYVPGPGAVQGGYTYTVAGLSPCANASAVVTVTQHRRPVAGTSAPLPLCSTDDPVNLFNSLGGTPDAGGTWTGPGGATSNGVFLPSAAGTFVYKYKVTGTAPCDPDSATVTVTVTQAPNAGTSGTLTICSGQNTVDLFDGLGGTPDMNGTWSEIIVTGRLSSHFFNPGVPTQLPPGNYDFRYIVPASGLCVADTATVRVTIVPLLDAGNNGTKNVCNTETQVNLFTGLGGSPQPGGVWVDLDATGQLTGQHFNAQGSGAGTYQFRYRLTGALGCNSDSATVTVNVIAGPNAGHEGFVTFCSDGPPVSLFSYISPADANGTWRKPAPGNQVFSGVYDPPTFSPGDYTYTVSGTGPCSAAVAVVHVSETPAANPGNAAVVTKCANDPSFDMTNALGGTPATNGTWLDPIGMSHTNIFVPGLDPAGVYLYTVAGTFPCGNKTVSLTVNVNPVPMAGGDAAITVCENASGFPLFNLLTGADLGGAWYDPDMDVFPTGFYVPGGSGPGVYTYRVTGISPCGVAEGTVTVFDTDPPEAGRDTSVTFCQTGAAVSLVNLLGGPHDLTGTWTGPSPSQAYFSGTFQPGANTPGTYTYHVSGVPPCGDDSSTVTVAVVPPFNAGISRSISVCSNAATFAMVDSLGGSGTAALNGSWYRLPSGPVSNGIFDPALPGGPPGSYPPGTYNFRYTVQGMGNSPCGPAQAVLTVIVTAAPNAGGNGNLFLCSTSGNTLMTPSLTGSPQTGGTWSYNGHSHGSSFNPLSDTAGVYTYTVTGGGGTGCANAAANVTVVVNQAPNAGSNGVRIICSPPPNAIVLREVLNGNPDPGGTWTLNGVTVSEIYHSEDHGPGQYTFMYTVTGQFPCSAATALATIIQNRKPEVGVDRILSVCSDDPSVDLFNQLGPTADSTGNWIDAAGALTSSVFVPHDHPAGTYVYRYIVEGDAPCVNDTATVSITVNRKPQAGISTAPQICTNSPIMALLSLLGGTPDVINGSWTYQPPVGPAVPHGPFFDPATDPAGPYIYTVTGSAPCTNSTATVQITLIDPPDAGLFGTMSVCVSECAVVLINGLHGAPQAGGTWTDINASGHLSNGIFNACAVAPGVYRFRYTVAGNGPCAQDTASVAVTVTPQLNAGDDASTVLCLSENVALTPYLGGTPQPGGVWTGIESQAGLINGVLNCSITGVGVHHYSYVLTGSSNCSPDSALLTVTIMTGPQAGSDGNTTTCSSVPSIDLFLSIGVPHDLNGTWYYPAPGGELTGSTIHPGSDPSGAYLYIVPPIGDCPADTAKVNVTITNAANAGTDGALSFCSNGASGNLNEGLGGSPDPGGSWTFGVPPVPHGPVYNPAIDVQGNYTYTVVGQTPCPNATAAVFVTETAAPFAGDDNSYTFCSIEGPFSMITKLAGNPQSGGTWRRDGSPPTTHGSLYNPATDSSGVFLYIRVGTGACANDTARLTVTEVRAPQPGHNAILNVCPTDAEVNLFAALGPDADSTGIWTDSNNVVLEDSLFDATQSTIGTYVFTYTVAGTSPCNDSIATVTVNVGAGLNAGIGGNDTICGAQTAYDLFGSLGGDPDTGGIWSEQTGVGAITGHQLNATLLVPGSSYPLVYTLNDIACGQVQSVVQMFIAPYPDPGADTMVIVCATSATFTLYPLLGHADPGGTWTAPDGTPADNNFDPATDPAGVYRYHLSGSAYCADTVARLTIVVNSPSNAGDDGTAQVCNDEQVVLFPLLSGGAQTGGAWTDLDGSNALTGGTVNAAGLNAGQYRFRYTVDVQGCPSDSSEVALLIVDGVTVSGVQRICNEVDRTYLVSFTLTGGTPSSYGVTGGPGTLSVTAPYVFTSAPIFTSQPFAFQADDANHCTPRTIEGTTPCEFQDEVFVPESFTPNDDGINDNFTIPGIEGYPGNNIVIFNRWGGEVYKAAGYDNVRTVWDGSSPKALVPGDASSGTYYYVLDLGDGSDPLKGFVYLNR
ncbi:MAG: gliding motility-associated C-terminal domain-containing protein [Flavobacteriales bacterium]|nr:gliding motility-associated C-terminal domain-containing protein [Flavobacteriales bacterium]